MSDGGGERLARNYTWRYDGRDWSLGVSVEEESYDYYKSRPRPRTEDYSIYVTDPVDDEMISSLARSFESKASEEGFSRTGTASFVTAFVQSMPYTPDNVTTDFDEYPRYPVETLADRGGDCEDTAILLSSVLDSMGYDVVLLELPGHMAIGVAVDGSGTYVESGGERYYYVETTGKGWKVGELPEDFEGLGITAWELDPVPVLVHSWNASARGRTVTVNVSVENVGTATADEVRVRGLLEDDGGTYDQSLSDPLTLDPGDRGIYRLELAAERNVEITLRVKVLRDGEIVDESHSQPVTIR